MKNYESISAYLSSQGIEAKRVDHKPSIIDLHGGDGSVLWSRFASQLESSAELTDSQESMSLASMASVHFLDIGPHSSVLDLCAAPGMKGLYINTIEPSVVYTGNDLSKDRLVRLKRLFSKHGVSYAQLSNLDSRFADKFYDHESFDRVLIDAPCSGEGVILGGDEKLLATWSPAKVKRLQQMQIRILKNGWTLLKPGERLVYATCTLNKNENERVIRKALGLEVEVITDVLQTDSLPEMSHGHAWRILPSKNSIGFFIAILDKPILRDAEQL